MVPAVAPSVSPTSGNAPLLVDVGANAYGSNKKQARLSVTFDGVTTPDCTLPVAYALSDDKPFVALDANAQVRGLCACSCSCARPLTARYVPCLQSQNTVVVVVGVAAAFQISATTTFKATCCLGGIPASPVTTVTVTVNNAGECPRCTLPCPSVASPSSRFARGTGPLAVQDVANGDVTLTPLHSSSFPVSKWYAFRQSVSTALSVPLDRVAITSIEVRC